MSKIFNKLSPLGIICYIKCALSVLDFSEFKLYLMSYAVLKMW